MKAHYAGRNTEVVPLGVTMDREAVDYLRSFVPQKLLGRVLSRLVFEERARREERARLKAEGVGTEAQDAVAP